LPRPPNDHLSYAITWFGLAAVLLVVFVVYATKKIPQPEKQNS
jgi:surfeit locus 1 family protein